MKTFKQNVIGVYGDKGKKWLTTLPDTVKKFAEKWQLSDLCVVNNLFYSYVLSGFQGEQPVILKIIPDSIDLNRETAALKTFKDYGAATLLEQQGDAILIKQAIPGYSLKKYFPDKDVEGIQIACNVMKALHRAPLLETHTFPNIRDWLSVVDKEWEIPKPYLDKARILKEQLLRTTKAEYLLHGDLHHENILKDGDNWVVIDPKGIIGDVAYEVTVFIYNPIPQLLESGDAVSIIITRIDQCLTGIFDKLARI